MQKLKEKTYTFLTTISIPGVPGIFTSSNIFFSIFWTLLLLALFGVGLWNIALAIMDFYNYDVISNIKRVSPENVTFPAITICTKGDFRKDYYVNGSLNRSEILSGIFGFGDLLYLAEMKTYNKSTDQYDTLSVKDKLESFAIIELFRNQYCLRFNAAKNIKTKELFTSSTRDYFVLYFRNKLKWEGGDKDYSTLNFLDQGTIFYVYITDNYLDSFKKMEPLELAIPKYGYIFKIDVASVETKLPEPYNNCKESPYNQMNCIEECIHNKIRSIYNCTLPNTLFRYTDLEACPYEKEAYLSYEKNEYNDYCKTECPYDDCNSKKLFWNYFDNWLKCDIKCDINNNYLVLSFYIRDLNYLNITEIPKTDPWTFINNIGGGLGLFMGIAFPNFVEFFQFITDIILKTKLV